MKVGTFQRPANAIAKIPKAPAWLQKITNPDPRLAAIAGAAVQLRSIGGFDPFNFANTQLASLKAELASRATAYAVNKLNQKKSQGLVPLGMEINPWQEAQELQAQAEELRAMVDAAKAQLEAGLAVTEGYVELL